MKCVRIAVVVTAAILIASTGFANVVWTGLGGNRNWDNPNNWKELQGDPPAPTGPARLPEAADEAYINGPAGQNNKPLIAEGMEAICKVLVTESGTPTIEMTGGHLELAGWGSWVGDGAGNIATFEMKGGIIDYTGSPGILELGWQPSGSTPGSCKGIWEMTGGVVNAKGISIPGGGGALGEFHLDGGVLNVGTARGGLMLHDDNASFDITAGVLVLEGDQQTKVADYASLGRLTAYGGDGHLMYDFDTSNPGMTTVMASLSFPGDLNGDGMVNSTDLDIVRGNWGQSVQAGCLPCGDASGDGTVDSADLDIVRANWGKMAPASAIPEPSTFALVLFGVAALFAKRR